MKIYKQMIKRQAEGARLLAGNGTDSCFGCPTFEKFKEKAIRESDSVFDAVIDTQDFCEKCYKTCVKRVDK